VPKPPVAPQELDDGFRVERATMRGVTYVLKELEAAEVEKALEQSRDEKTRLSDNNLLFRLMLAKSLTEPKLTIPEVLKKPYAVVERLNAIINDLHFRAEETDEEKADREREEAEEAEKAKAQAGEA
jgi:hypothetical protein